MPASTKTIFIILSIHAILRWRPFHVVPTRDRGPSRISSEDFPRRLGVRLPSIQQFVCYHTGKCQAIGLRPSRSSFKSSLETQREKVELPSQQNLQPSNAQCYDRSGARSNGVVVDTCSTAAEKNQHFVQPFTERRAL